MSSSSKVKLKGLAISDSGLVFDPVSGTISTSNATGLQILRALSDGKAPEEVSRDLLQQYDAPASTIERDVKDFIAQLQGSGYVHE